MSGSELSQVVARSKVGGVLRPGGSPRRPPGGARWSGRTRCGPGRQTQLPPLWFHVSCARSIPRSEDALARWSAGGQPLAPDSRTCACPRQGPVATGRGEEPAEPALLDLDGGGLTCSGAAPRGVLRRVLSDVGLEPDQAVAADHVRHESWSLRASRIGFRRTAEARGAPAGRRVGLKTTDEGRCRWRRIRHVRGFE